MSEKRFIDEPVEVREITNDKGTNSYIVGRGIVFNKWSQVLTAERPDGTRFQFIEKIMINPFYTIGYSIFRPI